MIILRCLRLGTLRGTAVSAARALYGGIGRFAVGDQGRQDATAIDRQQVTDRLGHGSGDATLVQIKSGQAGVGADSFGDGTGEEVVVKLHEFHCRKAADSFNAARKEVVVQIKRRQRTEAEQF